MNLMESNQEQVSPCCAETMSMHPGLTLLRQDDEHVSRRSTRVPRKGPTEEGGVKEVAEGRGWPKRVA
jgi:hypothetical protein